MRGYKDRDQVVVKKGKRAPKQKTIALRGSVVRFAILMEEILEKNDWKGGWERMTLGDLTRRAGQELKELRRALKDKSSDLDEVARNVAKEAADVANFCMMIADNSGGLDD